MKPPSAQDARRQALRKLADKIGHEFHDIDLLGRALVHSSMGNDGKQSYERLEFLGDAVLGFLVADYLYGLEPEVPEGDLTDRRAKFVAREPLAEAARQLDLFRYIEAGRGVCETPRIEADLLEAVLGAVYLDGGIRSARSFVDQHVIRLLRKSLGDSPSIRVSRDPKGRLQSCTLDRGLGLPSYHVIETEGPDHDYTFTVLVRVDGENLASGRGKSKQKAEMEAAENSLRILRAFAADQDKEAEADDGLTAD